VIHIRPWLFLLGLLVVTIGAADINEGELHFLEAAPNPLLHHHRKHLTIDRQSLDDGWIRDRQCHEHLDAVAAMQIVFAPGKVRQLRITQVENIGRAWIEGSSVQAIDVKPDAVLCLESELRALERDPATGLFLLASGPYMRRYLDGFFPLRLSLDIDYPADRLRIVDVQPTAVRAKSRLQPGRLQLHTTFEGRLNIHVQFEPVTSPSPGS
jgi:hypothetical protein